MHPLLETAALQRWPAPGSEDEQVVWSRWLLAFLPELDRAIGEPADEKHLQELGIIGNYLLRKSYEADGWENPGYVIALYNGDAAGSVAVVAIALNRTSSVLKLAGVA